jgi:hypothetical protein
MRTENCTDRRPLGWATCCGAGPLAAVASGLHQGEAVIVYPSDRVASGVRVGSRKARDLAGD